MTMEVCAATVNPVIQYENEELLVRFCEYLRDPVARALCALDEARAKGRALPERRRLERESRKYSTTMAVLSMMGEGYTQEEAARHFALSRNQVKYIVESVKEAYIRFADDEPRVSRSSLAREGELHES